MSSWIFALVSCVLPLTPCQAQNPAQIPDNDAKVPLELIAVGFRWGTNDKEGAMERADIFWSWRSPLAWEFTSGWDISGRLNASVGALHGQGETGAIGTLVPTIAIGTTDNFFAFEGGAGAALFSKWEFGGVEQFGGPLQWILEAGFNFRVYKRLGLGYRYTHWSDASIHGSDNRGVEMHMLEFSYRF